VPGLDIEKQGGSPSATEKKKEYTKDDIPQLVSRVVVAQLKVTEEKIRDNTRFVEDLGMDSLDSIEITMALEEELGFEIPDDDADRLRTFKQTVNYLQKKLITKKS
jgi:acyl carrier protein